MYIKSHSWYNGSMMNKQGNKMNKRIKELMNQTGIPTTIPFDQWCEKFAELIVKECAQVSEDVANADGTGPWFEGYVSGVEEVNRRIKQHFGVEE